ncbi:5-formyltetrahydrofolate cyclo-ligase [Mangrovihabitans endophyticus]|uniref:5-formyltetrahydrofolate cyclo-ligase n=1 Tax=Mangrovihabitans endophyticus TaxID=1751298 RepID=A0A8J3BYH8_9ACTN|nr:5-formyltetrahydrofolate cyclo-ligase [Mangrovihabitans endophyticus]GGK83710.1 5-formyltetrahydrofolate cyclo-ligase [Mangrovihabitans endophyticus]
MPDFAHERNDVRTVKTALRNRLITRRRGILPEDRRAAAVTVRAALGDLVASLRPSWTAAYAPVGSEPGGPDLPDALASMTRLLLPVLLPDGDLDWSEHHGGWTAGPYGLREPTGPRLGPAAVTRASLVVVPALAVDRAGLRMGRGGGSYDRALSRLDALARNHTGPRTAPFVVALLHDGELLDAVPAEPHDRRVHAAITPTEGLTLLGSRAE